MGSENRTGSKIYQTQCGPLKVVVSDSIELFSEPFSGIRNKQEQTIMSVRGVMKIVNAGNNLIAFKVTSIGVDELEVSQTEGVLESKDLITLKISGILATRRNSIRPSLGIVVLATTCEILNFDRVDLRSFWSKIFHEGSVSYVDIFPIKRFALVDARGYSQTLNYETDESQTSDSSVVLNDDQGSSSSLFYTAESHSSSTSQKSSYDSDGSGDTVRKQRRNLKNVLKAMKNMSGRLVLRKRTLFRREFLSVFLLIFIMFWTAQAHLEKLGAGISNWARANRRVK